VSDSACRDQQSTTITDVTFHPKKPKQSPYTELTFADGSTQSVNGDRTIEVSVGDEVPITLWKGRITDFALLGGTEHHTTQDNPDHIAGSRATTAAVLLGFALLACRAALWERLITRVRAKRFVPADGLLAVMLVATCLLAATQQAAAELAMVLVTVLAAGASMAMGRLAWVAKAQVTAPVKPRAKARGTQKSRKTPRSR
jgi:hypothetical protein